MTICGLSPALVIGLALTFLVSFRKAVVFDCMDLMRRLYPHQLRGNDRYLGDEGALDKDIYRATDGIVGLWKRWRNRIPLLRLCQLRSARHGLRGGDMDYITQRIAELTMASLWALLLGCVRFAVPEISNRATFRAFRLYAEIADRTHVFFSSDNASVCAMRLASLL